LNINALFVKEKVSSKEELSEENMYDSKFGLEVLTFQ